MYTGLIRHQGLLAARGAASLLVDCPGLRSSLNFGDSVSVNGVCLTVARLSETGFGADLLPATLEVTTLGTLAIGSRLNLELPLGTGELFGGHLVRGVVDGTVELLAREELPGGALRLSFRLEDWLKQWLVPKGAVCLDGVSLTVQRLDEAVFTTELIPTTQAETNLGTILPSARVNVEADLIVKSVRTVLEGMGYADRVPELAAAVNGLPASKGTGD
ncbi:riboflavin synthase [bacterium]|nr:riboflavin synthase [bacterium]